MIYRHSVGVRVWHWVNALAIIMLLLSGMYIFNQTPALYWGEEGYEGLPALASVHVNTNTSTLRIGGHTFNTTGVLGFAVDDPENPGVKRTWAFSPVLVFPLVGHLGDARAIHFTMAWVLALSLFAYLLHGLFSGHVWNDLVPTRAQMQLRHILHDLGLHLRLKRYYGAEARSYNVLQRLTYLLVIGVLLPAQIFSGMMISSSFGAILPQAYIVLGGRQGARTIHFILAFLIVLFVSVHLFQVVISGVRNEIVSMITGRFEVPHTKEHRP